MQVRSITERGEQAMAAGENQKALKYFNKALDLFEDVDRDSSERHRRRGVCRHRFSQLLSTGVLHMTAPVLIKKGGTHLDRRRARPREGQRRGGAAGAVSVMRRTASCIDSPNLPPRLPPARPSALCLTVENVRLRSHRGEAQIASRKLEEAVRSFAQALAIEPHNDELHACMKRAQEKREQFTQVSQPANRDDVDGATIMCWSPLAQPRATDGLSAMCPSICVMRTGAGRDNEIAKM
jgi:tetratricopeptide (TPR) repeat protein